MLTLAPLKASYGWLLLTRALYASGQHRTRVLLRQTTSHCSQTDSRFLSQQTDQCFFNEEVDELYE